MPSAETHRKLTQVALEKCQPLASGDNAALIQDYCIYPDNYFCGQHKEIAPYTFFKDSIQFHYPPHTPYEEAYRYWGVDSEGTLFHPRKFVNHNFEFMLPGFQFYFSRSIDCLRSGEEEEARKYLGCLLHTLEDSTFGLHALEGPGGSDAFVLDRMVQPDDFPVSPSHLSARINSEECHDFAYTPHTLGRSADEASMRLYTEYVAYVGDSRRRVFSYIMKANSGDRHGCALLTQQMFENAVKICANAAYTVFSIGKGINEVPPECSISDLEPHVFPFGGFAPYCYASFERNCALNKDGRRIPIKLKLPNGVQAFEKGLSFGTHSEGSLLFWIAPGCFPQHTVTIGFHADMHFGTADLLIINDGKVVEEVLLDDAAHSIALKPDGIFGLSFKSSANAGCLCFIG